MSYRLVWEHMGRRKGEVAASFPCEADGTVDLGTLPLDMLDELNACVVNAGNHLHGPIVVKEGNNE